MTRATAPRVGVCDYGVSNVRSVERALAHSGAQVVVSARAADLSACDGLVLPGVGAFTAAADALHRHGLDATVTEYAASGRPLLGVCLGFQLLFDGSDEGGGAAGLGLVAGRVTRLDAGRGKVPHIGWNRLHLLRESALLRGIEEGDRVYFVHSYAALPEARDVVVATTDHGGEVVAAIAAGNIAGTQFHPEKSGPVGLRVYANFVARCAAPVRV